MVPPLPAPCRGSRGRAREDWGRQAEAAFQGLASAQVDATPLPASPLQLRKALLRLSWVW